MEKYGSKKRYITSRRGIKKQPVNPLFFNLYEIVKTLTVGQ